MRYGTWASPITAELLARGAARLDEVAVDGDGTVYFTESRPAERGRVALMQLGPGGVREVTPPDANVRTAVHEYGGGAWHVRDGTIVYSSLPDHRLWRLSPHGGAPEALTAPSGSRYADGRLSPDGRWYVCVRETHHGAGHSPDVENDIVAVATDESGRVVPLASGADFYSSPRLSPDGAHLAWLEWHHPDMPWDRTELWVAGFDASGPALGAPRRAAGASAQSIVQPEWSSEGHVYFCTDANEWWNLHRIDGGAGAARAVVEGDFEIALPQWVFGQSRYCFLPGGRVAYVEGHPDGDRLVIAGRPVASPISSYAQIVAAPDGAVIAFGGTPDAAPALWRITEGGCEVVYRPPAPELDPALFSPPEHVTFPTVAGDAHALFYRPANPSYSAPSDELPPLIVMAHGGPTSAARPQLSLALRYWTSRGFAVADVNYRGSTGYGKAYRRSLDGEWGIADVADCVAAARFLAARGDVDGSRLAIRGGSAGGFTVLCALAFHAGVFAAGASHYGIADLEALAIDTHKFESRYLDRLIAPYPAARSVYVERSPIHHVERLTAPMIVLQGLDDKVVPPNQAEMIVEALRRRGVRCDYLTFEGEGHGFRQAASIERAIEAEAAFYRDVFGLVAPAD